MLFRPHQSRVIPCNMLIAESYQRFLGIVFCGSRTRNDPAKHVFTRHVIYNGASQYQEIMIARDVRVVERRHSLEEESASAQHRKMSQFRSKRLDLSGFINGRVIRDHTKRKVFEQYEPER